MLRIGGEVLPSGYARARQPLPRAIRATLAPMKIAFIGLGAMGYPMARNLARHHEVVVWNRTTAVAERHAAEHGTVFARRLDELSDCGVVISILPTSREVDEVVDQLLPLLGAGTLWIDATSGDPSSSRGTAERLMLQEVRFLDAPVSGGIPGAEAAALTFMAGAADDDFASARPVLELMGSRIVHVGPVGSGHAIKAITNSMMAANLWVASEALVALRRQGFDMNVALDVINGASGRSNVTENLLPKRVIDGEWPLTFKLGLLDKDVRIAAHLSHELHLASPLLALTSQLYTAAGTALGGDADYIEVLRYVAALNGDPEAWRD